MSAVASVSASAAASAPAPSVASSAAASVSVDTHVPSPTAPPPAQKSNIDVTEIVGIIHNVVAHYIRSKAGAKVVGHQCDLIDALISTFIKLEGRTGREEVQKAVIETLTADKGFCTAFTKLRTHAWESKRVDYVVWKLAQRVIDDYEYRVSTNRPLPLPNKEFASGKPVRRARTKPRPDPYAHAAAAAAAAAPKKKKTNKKPKDHKPEVVVAAPVAQVALPPVPPPPPLSLPPGALAVLQMPRPAPPPLPPPAVSDQSPPVMAAAMVAPAASQPVGNAVEVKSVHANNSAQGSQRFPRPPSQTRVIQKTMYGGRQYPTVLELWTTTDVTAFVLAMAQTATELKKYCALEPFTNIINHKQFDGNVFCHHGLSGEMLVEMLGANPLLKVESVSEDTGITPLHMRVILNKIRKWAEIPGHRLSEH